jgi:flavodoxin
MKTVAIFYFSGTGNTEIVAGMIKQKLSELQYDVTLIRIEDDFLKHLLYCILNMK